MIGDIESRSLKNDADGLDHPVNVPVALGATSQRSVTKGLMALKSDPTRITLIDVDWHGNLPLSMLLQGIILHQFY